MCTALHHFTDDSFSLTHSLFLFLLFWCCCCYCRFIVEKRRCLMTNIPSTCLSLSAEGCWFCHITYYRQCVEQNIVKCAYDSNKNKKSSRKTTQFKIFFLFIFCWKKRLFCHLTDKALKSVNRVCDVTSALRFEIRAENEVPEWKLCSFFMRNVIWCLKDVFEVDHWFWLKLY